MVDLAKIEDIISSTSYITEILSIEDIDRTISGKFVLQLEKMPRSLVFSFEIFSIYPFKFHDRESIKFTNTDLLEYDHVMEDGSICIHTSHSVNIKEKLIIDLNSLKDWVLKYYINKETNKKYEHVIINHQSINDKHSSYIFTDVDYTFKRGDCGIVELSNLATGSLGNQSIDNHIVQQFVLTDGTKIECQWSDHYLNQPINNKGFFIFTKCPPARYKKFAFKEIIDFTPHMHQSFLNRLYRFNKENTENFKGTVFPVFIGYDISDELIHWNVLLLEIGKFPIVFDYIVNIAIKKLSNERVVWAYTHNASYRNYFGRGALNKNITNAKILLIGIGAIGSILAKSLVKGGCKFISIADHDTKYPDNVCRSEYNFVSGITKKTDELVEILTQSSPFVEISIIKDNYFEIPIKQLSTVPEFENALISNLNKYDYIFDCTTDNDLMYILDSLKLNCQLINLSITNHATNLVCAFHPNIYRFVITLFDNILSQDVTDLHEPIGCWHPTFKASYTDISLLIQSFIKQLNYFETNRITPFNFIVKTATENRIATISINEY